MSLADHDIRSESAVLVEAKKSLPAGIDVGQLAEALRVALAGINAAETVEAPTTGAAPSTATESREVEAEMLSDEPVASASAAMGSEPVEESDAHKATHLFSWAGEKYAGLAALIATSVTVSLALMTTWVTQPLHQMTVVDRMGRQLVFTLPDGSTGWNLDTVANVPGTQPMGTMAVPAGYDTPLGHVPQFIGLTLVCLALTVLAHRTRWIEAGIGAVAAAYFAHGSLDATLRAATSSLSTLVSSTTDSAGQASTLVLTLGMASAYVAISVWRNDGHWILFSTLAKKIGGSGAGVVLGRLLHSVGNHVEASKHGE